MSAPDPRVEYQSRCDAAATSAARLDWQGFWLANARLVTFVGAVAIAALVFAKRLPVGASWGAGAFVVLLLAAAVLHDKVLGQERRARVRQRLNERGLARLDDRWESLGGDGACHADPDHPYASDLDLFGPSSLFQRLDATSTRYGEQELVAWLKGAASPSQVAERQEAVQELGPQLDLRQAVEIEGHLLAEAKPDPSFLITWAEGAGAFASPLWRVVSIALPSWTIAAWFADQQSLAPPAAWAVPLCLQAALVLLSARAVARVFRKVNAPGEKLLRFEHLFAAFERLKPSCELLKGLSEKVKVDGAQPSAQMRKLARAIAFLAAREQPMFHLPLSIILLWDLHFVSSLERWRQASGKAVRGWFEALGSFEALSSLAGFAFENPGHAYPSVTPGPTRLTAHALGHPLLPASRRVCNDLELSCPGSVLLVTGSNMAGKTTLLRTLGVNAVLALAGAPVCAEQMTLSQLQIATSMRVQDSLARGLSFFYAELKRLKSVLDLCSGQPALFLLDEVLQGTNTAERQAASRAIVKRLVELGAIGAIATHDLGLTSLEGETGGKVRNVHFTDCIQDGEMTFDYRLRPGVVATTNALALLAKVGIDIEVHRP